MAVGPNGRVEATCGLVSPLPVFVPVVELPFYPCESTRPEVFAEGFVALNLVESSVSNDRALVPRPQALQGLESLEFLTGDP